eukprot:jgi/Mesvir1/232/Mv13575-RA.1
MEGSSVADLLGILQLPTSSDHEKLFAVKRLAALSTSYKCASEAVTLGGVPSLAEQLREHVADRTRGEAAQALAGIASHSAKFRAVVAGANVVPILSGLVAKGTLDSKLKASNTLLALSVIGSVREEMVSLGLGRTFVNLLRNRRGAHRGLLPVIDNLDRLARTPAACEDIIDAGGVDVILSFCQEVVERAQLIHGLQVLYYLCVGRENVQAVVGRTAVPLLLDLAAGASDAVQCCAAELLTVLATHAGNKSLIGHAGGVSVLKDLMAFGSFDTRVNALACLERMASGAVPDDVRHLLEDADLGCELFVSENEDLASVVDNLTAVTDPEASCHQRGHGHRGGGEYDDEDEEYYHQPGRGEGEGDDEEEEEDPVVAGAYLRLEAARKMSVLAMDKRRALEIAATERAIAALVAAARDEGADAVANSNSGHGGGGGGGGSSPHQPHPGGPGQTTGGVIPPSLAMTTASAGPSPASAAPAPLVRLLSVSIRERCVAALHALASHGGLFHKTVIVTAGAIPALLAVLRSRPPRRQTCPEPDTGTGILRRSGVGLAGISGPVTNYLYHSGYSGGALPDLVTCNEDCDSPTGALVMAPLRGGGGGPGAGVASPTRHYSGGNTAAAASNEYHSNSSSMGGSNSSSNNHMGGSMGGNAYPGAMGRVNCYEPFPAGGMDGAGGSMSHLDFTTYPAAAPLGNPFGSRHDVVSNPGGADSPYSSRPPPGDPSQGYPTPGGNAPLPTVLLPQSSPNQPGGGLLSMSLLGGPALGGALAHPGAASGANPGTGGASTPPVMGPGSAPAGGGQDASSGSAPLPRLGVSTVCLYHAAETVGLLATSAAARDEIIRVGIIPWLLEVVMLEMPGSDGLTGVAGARAWLASCGPNAASINLFSGGGGAGGVGGLPMGSSPGIIYPVNPLVASLAAGGGYAGSPMQSPATSPSQQKWWWGTGVAVGGGPAGPGMGGGAAGDGSVRADGGGMPPVIEGVPSVLGPPLHDRSHSTHSNMSSNSIGYMMGLWSPGTGGPGSGGGGHPISGGGSGTPQSVTPQSTGRRESPSFRTSSHLREMLMAGDEASQGAMSPMALGDAAGSGSSGHGRHAGGGVMAMPPMADGTGPGSMGMNQGQPEGGGTAGHGAHAGYRSGTAGGDGGTMLAADGNAGGPAGIPAVSSSVHVEMDEQGDEVSELNNLAGGLGGAGGVGGLASGGYGGEVAPGGVIPPPLGLRSSQKPLKVPRSSSSFTAGSPYSNWQRSLGPLNVPGMSRLRSNSSSSAGVSPLSRASFSIFSPSSSQGGTSFFWPSGPSGGPMHTLGMPTGMHLSSQVLDPTNMSVGAGGSSNNPGAPLARHVQYHNRRRSVLAALARLVGSDTGASIVIKEGGLDVALYIITRTLVAIYAQMGALGATSTPNPSPNHGGGNGAVTNASGDPLVANGSTGSGGGAAAPASPLPVPGMQTGGGASGSPTGQTPQGPFHAALHHHHHHLPHHRSVSGGTGTGGQPSGAGAGAGLVAAQAGASNNSPGVPGGGPPPVTGHARLGRSSSSGGGSTGSSNSLHAAHIAAQLAMPYNNEVVLGALHLINCIVSGGGGVRRSLTEQVVEVPHLLARLKELGKVALSEAVRALAADVLRVLLEQQPADRSGGSHGGGG